MWVCIALQTTCECFLTFIGTGLVGSAFLRQLASIKKSFPNYNVVVIARSKKAIISKDYAPLSLVGWEDALSKSETPSPSIEELISYLEKSPVPAILVDNTSNQDLAEAYPKFLQKSISIATPNKKAFSSGIDLWTQIFDSSKTANGGLVYHEASVGAGLPTISTLNDLVLTGDKIKKIEGIASGTLSYIFNTFSTLESDSDVKFSDVVIKAKELGYTEPDPREDLNGLDVARKVTILSRLAGLLTESPSSFPVQSLIPKPLESVSTAEEFLGKLPEYDDVLDKLRKEAQSEGKVLRYVGKIDISSDVGPNGNITVGIEKYSSDHPFASLKGSDNVISYVTERYPNPLIIQGAGAGAEVTAAGVLGDVIKISQRVAH